MVSELPVKQLYSGQTGMEVRILPSELAKRIDLQERKRYHAKQLWAELQGMNNPGPPLPDSVTAARNTLNVLVLVRIQIGQL